MNIRVFLRVIVCGLLLVAITPRAEVRAANRPAANGKDWRARIVNRIGILARQE